MPWPVPEGEFFMAAGLMLKAAHPDGLFCDVPTGAQGVAVSVAMLLGADSFPVGSRAVTR